MSSALEAYKLEFEDIPVITRKSSGGKDSKMSNKSTAVEAPKASSKKYTKSRGEHAKDILIAVLVTAVIAFIGGMSFQSKQNAEVKNAVSAAVAPKAEAAPLK